MRKFLSLLLVCTLAFSLAACSGGSNGSSSSSASPADAQPSKTTKPSEGSAPATEGGAGSGDYVVGLSNSYYGNTWRKQMVEIFEQVAAAAQTDGLIASYEVQNGDNTVNAQIAQINSFILSDVDAICINAASPTALNSVIDQAVDQGIVVVAFDSIVNTEKAYTIDNDWNDYGGQQCDYILNRLNGTGNVIIIRGVSGSSSDQGINTAIHNRIDGEAGIKVVAEIYGEASATKTQEELMKLLPSLPEVDAVFTNGGGDALGVVRAFEQAGREVPIVMGDNSAEFIQWWIQAKEESGYETISVGTGPGCSSAAFWAALNILDGKDVPREMYLGITTVTQDTVEQYADLQPGTIVSEVFSNEYVVNNLIGKP